jgi:hypothetical protein
VQVIGYRILNDKDEPWAGQPKPLPFSEAREHLLKARATGSQSWRMVSVSQHGQQADRSK